MPVALSNSSMPPAPCNADRAAYRAEVERRGVQAVRAACWLAIALVPCFGVLDQILFPDHVRFFVALRAACLAGIGATLWLLGRPGGRRRPELLALAVALLIVAMIDVMIAATGGIASRYWAGLSLVLLGLTVLMPWAPHWPIAATLLIIASYVATVATVGLPPDTVPILVNNLAFLASTGVIAAVGSRRASRLQWREFVQRAALEEALRHKSEFMAKMSHELRTPLHAIVGYTDMLRDGNGIPAEDRDLLDRIRSRSTFLHRMISELLDFAKVEAGKMRIRREPVDVVVVVEQAVATLRPLAARKHLAVVVTSAPGLAPVAGDAHRVEQIVLNLVANAIKFTDAGSVHVGVERVTGPPAEFLPLETTTTWPATAQGVAIQVRDTGIGIHADDLRELAHDFHQADHAARDHGGTGLGLSISRKLAALLGGALFVQSVPAAGSTFVLVLPLGSPALKTLDRRAA